MPKTAVTIAYFPIRGKAQVCRLLCEYIGVDYSDKLYSLPEWEMEKKVNKKNCSLKQLPYIQENNFKVTGSIPMCLYIIDRFSNGQLLGKSLPDQALIDMYLWTLEPMSGIIKMNCQKKSESEIRAFKNDQWQSLSGKLQKYEEVAGNEEWFLSYLTIIDFSIYELMRYIELIFSGKTREFPKLRRIAILVNELKPIRDYQNSQKAIKEMCPSSLLKQMKLQAKESQN